MFFRRKLFFRIARIFGMFIIGMIVAVFIALSQVNLETLRSDILAVLRDATDMPVEIDGGISWKFSLRPRVELNQVRIPNEAWAKNKQGFTAQRVDVTLNLLSLFQDRPTIQSVRVHDAKLFLEKNDQDEYSLQQIKEEDTKKSDETVAVAKQDKYPFKDPGLGAVSISNLDMNINGEKYLLAGFHVGYRRSKEGREYNGWFKPDTKLYPFIISFSEYNEERKVYPVRIALSTGGDALVANVALEGTSKMPIDFILKGNIPDPQGLAKLFHLDMPRIPSIAVNLAGGFGHNKLTLRKSSVSIRTSDITLSGGIDWSGKIPNITAKIASDKIDLMEVLPDMYSSGKKWVRPKRDLNVFKDTPLYGTELWKYNLTLDADVDNLMVYRDLVIKDIDLHAKLKDANMRVDADVFIADGNVKAAADIAADKDGKLTVRAAGLGERVYLGEILQNVGVNDYISELPMNFEFYLESEGSDLSEVMARLMGPIYIYSVAPGYAHSSLVSYMYGSDFLTDLRHSITDLFSSKKKNDQIKISCASANLKVRYGRIETEHGVAAETNAINIRFGGKVNLAKEELKVSMVTVPVRGLKISLTGNVVNSIEFSGNLAEPTIKINGTAVAGKVASATGIGLLLAPFTGGIGLVAGAGVGWLAGDLIENWLADDHPCRTAMEKGAPSKKDDPEWMNRPMAELVSGMIK